jgi:hypothetical protein
MGVFNRKGASPSSSSSRDRPPEKTEYGAHAYQAPHDLPQQEIHGIEFSEESRLTRGLKARHITMIAIGGAIGTGLIIGTGVALSRPCVDADFLLNRRIDGMDRDECSWRDGCLAASLFWLHWIRGEVLRSRPRVCLGMDVRR